MHEAGFDQGRRVYAFARHGLDVCFSLEGIVLREIFLNYAKKGLMTKEQLAEVLNLKPAAVWRMAKDGKIPRIPGIHFYRFDPMVMIAVFCEAQGSKESRSLTIERHKTGAKPNGGFRKCL